MNNEIAIRSLENTMALYSDRSDLLAQTAKAKKEKNPKSQVDDLVIKRLLKGHSDSVYNIDKVFLFSSLTGAFTSGVVSTMMFGASGVTIVAIPLMTSAICASAAYGFGLKIVDSIRLKKAMKSKDPKKRAYYVNRVIDFMILRNPKDNPIFDNPYTLGYALWLNETGRELRYHSKHREYRKLFAKVDFSQFKEDPLYVFYIALAQDMINGVLDKQVLPRIAQTDSERIMFEKYEMIIQSRKQSTSGSCYISSHDRWQEEFVSNKMKRKKESEEMEIYAAKLVEQRKQITENLNLEVADLSNKQVDTETVQQISIDIEAQDYSEDLQILKDVENKWLDTQSDIVQILKYPMFADMREPLVKEFHTHLSIAKSLSKRTLGNDFMVAVSNLQTSWTSLECEARRVELSNFDDGERKKILMATNLMNIALNEASSPPERQSAYKKAMEQLKGLLTIPDRAMQVIEQAVRKEELVA